MTEDDLKKRLRRLGLTTPSFLVRTIARRLTNGETPYSIWHSEAAPASKKTVEKIARKLKDGELNFILDLTAELDVIEDVLRERSMAFPPLIPRLSNAGPESPIYRRLKELEPLLPKIDWNIGELESYGFDTADGLEILKSRDALISESSDLWTMLELHRYVSLHYRVAFQRQECARATGAPDMVIERASSLFAKGMIDDDHRLMDGAYAIFRYQTWRGEEYRRAYLDAQTNTRSVHEANFFRELEETAHIQCWYEPKESDVEEG